MSVAMFGQRSLIGVVVAAQTVELACHKASQRDLISSVFIYGETYLATAHRFG
jgi:hypothetical protein